jgi:ATP-dependent DNA ligase
MTSTIDAGGPLAWRPQVFGKQKVRQIADPLIEPLWDGDRVLVHVSNGDTTIIDIAGEHVEEVPEIAEAVLEAARAASFVVDGYITPQAARSGEGAMIGEVSVPTATQMATQLFLGRGGELRRKVADEDPLPVAPGDPLVLVCVDLLAIDDEPILDVPLLERKRLLESALEESALVRIGAYVRLPVDPWLGSWRAQGFRALAYKEANGRYRPGEVSAGWAIATIPKR